MCFLNLLHVILIAFNDKILTFSGDDPCLPPTPTSVTKLKFYARQLSSLADWMDRCLFRWLIDSLTG